jgi:hypothetical protein
LFVFILCVVFCAIINDLKFDARPVFVFLISRRAV